MPSLRELIDRPREIFDATVAAHNDRLTPSLRTRRESTRLDANASVEAERRERVDVSRYMHEIQALGERVQHEYSRGYNDGYRDGVYAGSNIHRPVAQELKPAPKARTIQSNRDVDLDE